MLRERDDLQNNEDIVVRSKMSIRKDIEKKREREEYREKCY